MGCIVGVTSLKRRGFRIRSSVSDYKNGVLLKFDAGFAICEARRGWEVCIFGRAPMDGTADTKSRVLGA
jgi:hypothetical protein